MTKPKICITYCPKCGWLLRAAWLAQELLTTFSENLSAVSLEPAEESGRFMISIKEHTDGEIIVWERKRDHGFPEAKVLKQRVRDIIDPQRSLGHSDYEKNRTE